MSKAGHTRNVQSRNRNRWKRFDQRTGRLERAVAMVEDGNTGMWVRRGEDDKKHPLDKTFVPPIDRAQLKGNPVPEPMRGTTVIDVGYASVGSNFERPQMDVITIPTSGGTFTYTTADGGYGEGGFGEFGYGGATGVDEEGIY